MTTLKLTQIGNSVGVILPKEVLAKLKVEKGDTLFVTEATNGVTLTPYDPGLDEQIAAGKLSAEEISAAERQLAICEGSDWFWWFGDYNPAGSVSDFEQLYRTQLRELYRMLGVAPPALLDVPLSSGGGWSENAGTMRRNA